MYLNEPKQLDIIKKQFHLKLNANAVYFTILVALQLLVLLISFPAQMSSSHFSENSSITMIGISSTVHIIVMLMWSFSLGLTLTNQPNWDEAFVFVTTRLTHHLANLLFILFAALVTGLIGSLLGPALRLLSHLQYGETYMLTATLVEAPSHFVLQFITVASYALLLLVFGYTIGSCVKASKLSGGVFIAIFFISIFIITFILGIGVQMIGTIISFLFIESFLPFFLMKIIGISTVLFCFSIFVTSRAEVRNS